MRPSIEDRLQNVLAGVLWGGLLVGAYHGGWRGVGCAGFLAASVACVIAGSRLDVRAGKDEPMEDDT